MKHVTAPVKNIKRAMGAFDEALNRSTGTPGMALFYGLAGAGKSTATAYLVNRYKAVHVRAQANWTPSSMLGAIVRELGIEMNNNSSAARVDVIVQAMAENSRALFVDEADHLFRNPVMVETLRDIHDLSTMPVVLVGMEGIDRKIALRKQLARRITQFIEFHPVDMDDARLYVKTVAEIPIAPELVEHLHNEANGSIGLMAVGLGRIEKSALLNEQKEATLDWWLGTQQRLFLKR